MIYAPKGGCVSGRKLSIGLFKRYSICRLYWRGMRRHKIVSAILALIWLRQVCLAVEKDNRLRDELSATDFVNTSHEHSIFIPGLANEATDEKAKLHLGRLLGRIFGEHYSCECDGFLVTKVGDGTI